MPFFRNLFGGESGKGGGSGTPGSGLPLGGPGNQGLGAATLFAIGAIGKKKPELANQLFKDTIAGRTKTKFGGLLGTSQQADTAKKTLLGQ